MSERVLWGHLKSSNVMKVLWLLEELGLPYERRDVGNVYGGTDTPAYLAMNPTRLVPTLQEGDFSLWESNVILRYLCAAHAPDSPLFPADPRRRAGVDRWLDAQQTLLTRPQTVVFFQLVRTPAEQRDPALLTAAIAEAGKAWALIDAQLAKHDFVAGPGFTLADIVWGVHAHRWLNMDFLGFARPDLPHLRPWYERLLTHAAFKTHWAGPIV